jgi:hypothetical protein
MRSFLGRFAFCFLLSSIVLAELFFSLWIRDDFRYSANRLTIIPIYYVVLLLFLGLMSFTAGIFVFWRIVKLNLPLMQAKTKYFFASTFYGTGMILLYIGIDELIHFYRVMF